MISLKVLIGVSIFLLSVILVLLVRIAFLKGDINTFKKVNRWLREDLEEANAKLKIAMGLPIDAKNCDETFPLLYRRRETEEKYDGYMGLG